MTDNPSTRPVVTLLPGRQKRAEGGHPWIYSNELAMDAAAKALPPGSLVTVLKPDGKRLGVATFNSHPLVSARLISRDATQRIDRDFLAKRLRRALSLREKLVASPCYRLIHAEADGFPGLIIDRYGSNLVCQLNTAGMARLEGLLIEALDQVLEPEAILLRNDSPAREAEGLPAEQRFAKGEFAGPIEIIENGLLFSADPAGGQKTGWFFDQRENRAFVASLAKGGRVLDLYSYAGGFAVHAAAAGASEVVAIDRSEAALALASASAERNGVAGRCTFRCADVFAEIERLHQAGERFDVVVADPPAFAKSKKDVGPALRGYRKLSRLAASLVAKGGFLFSASCSHNVELASFAEAVRQGLQDADRGARILRTSGAASDHPVHPSLPESAYLKAQTLAVD